MMQVHADHGSLAAARRPPASAGLGAFAFGGPFHFDTEIIVQAHRGRSWFCLRTRCFLLSSHCPPSNTCSTKHTVSRRDVSRAGKSAWRRVEWTPWCPMNQPTGFRRLNPGRSSLPWRRKGAAARYLSRQRLQEVLVLHGSPLLGAALALEASRWPRLISITTAEQWDRLRSSWSPRDSPKLVCSTERSVAPCRDGGRRPNGTPSARRSSQATKEC
jgi:hypothetical protein